MDFKHDPKQRDDLARYVTDMVTKAKDARQQSRFAERYRENYRRYLSRGRPKGLEDEKLWVSLGVTRWFVNALFGLIKRAERDIDVDPIGEEDQEHAGQFKLGLDVLFKEAKFWPSAFEAMFDGVMHGLGGTRSSVDEQGNLRVQRVSPLSFTVDPDADEPDFSDRRFVVHFMKMDRDVAKSRYRRELPVSNTYRELRGEKKRKNEATIAEVEWWCPADGEKIYFNDEPLVIQDKDIESIPETDRDDLTAVDLLGQKGYWRLTSIMLGGETDGTTILEDRPTGLQHSIWSLFTFDAEEEDTEGAVGLGDHLRELQDAISGAVSQALDAGSRSNSFIARFRDKLPLSVRRAIKKGQIAIHDNLGEELKNSSDILEFPNRAQGLVDLANMLLQFLEMQSTISEAATGVAPGANTPGVTVARLQSAAIKVISPYEENFQGFIDHQGALGVELIQRKIPYPKKVRIVDDQNGEKKRSSMTLGVMPEDVTVKEDSPFLFQRWATPLRYDLNVRFDIDAAVQAARTEDRGANLLQMGHLDLAGYLHYIRDPRSGEMTQMMDERNQAISLGKWLLEHPDQLAKVEGAIQLEQQLEAIGEPLNEDNEDFYPEP
ncbi:hypothetical protein KQI63_05835 [bacterium]|nr:hypothetical protein [bacterium]